jgi:heme-degrading monooxygenase HmoA
VHVSVTRTNDPLDQPIELATIAGEEMLPWLSEIEGFEGLLMLSNAATGTTLVLTFWESEEVAREHAEARRRFRERVTTAVGVEVVDTSGYELTYAHLGAWASGPGEG